VSGAVSKGDREEGGTEAGIAGGGAVAIAGGEGEAAPRGAITVVASPLFPLVSSSFCFDRLSRYFCDFDLSAKWAQLSLLQIFSLAL
jgi:hypothetical protein